MQLKTVAAVLKSKKQNKGFSMRYAVIIEEDKLDGGYTARVPSLKGCFTQADTLDELKVRIEEAIEASLEDGQGESDTSLFGIWEIEVGHAAASGY